MAVASPVLNVSDHILNETRKCIRAGWLADGKHVVAAGMTEGFELYDVASRRPAHPMHRTAINRETGESRCTCEGHRSRGRCTHTTLCFALNGAIYEAILGWTIPIEEERMA